MQAAGYCAGLASECLIIKASIGDGPVKVRPGQHISPELPVIRHPVRAHVHMGSLQYIWWTGRPITLGPSPGSG